MYAYLRILGRFLPALYALYIYRSAIQGMGNNSFSVFSSFVELLMRIGGIFLLLTFLGESGVYIAEVSAWVGANLILIPGYYRLAARHINTSTQPDAAAHSIAK